MQIQEGDYIEYRSGPRQISRGTVVEVHDDYVRVENEVSLHVPLILKTSITKILHRPHRANPPLSEHMAYDDLDEIASMLAERFASAVAGGRASGFSEFSLFIRKLSGELFKQVESYADARISDERQARLSDLAEVAANVARHTTLPARR